MYWTISVVAVCVVLVTGTHAATCTQKDLCSCSMDDGSGDIDVSSLGKQDGTAMFQDMASSDGTIYSLNLCYPFNEMACANAAACQILADGSASYQIGDATNVGFETDTLNQVHIKYTNIDQGSGLTRTTDVTLVCNPSADPPMATADGETAPGSVTYLFTVNTKCGCPGQCGGGPAPPDPTTTKGPNPGPGPAPNTSSEGISIGTILVIVALALGFSYLVGGILFMKMVRHARGTEVVPNVSFWGSLPGLVKDGFVFTIGKCKRGGYSKV
ncbi:putative mannose 6-phosphate receptor-like protein C530.09c [Mizuhopecten yessoensis]|uniref:Autophagy-related protein 27 n=1 Tax=Mizuhopecten yessoensis TaxID=6573 RepID=A0A210PF54_MIZYE|nr:putative mannose 6-phosphate receptor-like protein C530.09c [Mizuhopecten yessoensis]OWF35125.1 Mannose 6-phosphate receptor-like protein [Mizuhopecten yessoensis]